MNFLSDHHEVTIYDNLSNSSKENIGFLIKKELDLYIQIF
ncbi:MAG TPA: hypothetical protein VMW55_04860 [Nitrosopumilaceae archaeon]|nr:hypothetical protein [Nitrosopumilaceae archaeon]